jgi:hypothetical protein
MLQSLVSINMAYVAEKNSERHKTNVIETLLWNEEM